MNVFQSGNEGEELLQSTNPDITGEEVLFECEIIHSTQNIPDDNHGEPKKVIEPEVLALQDDKSSSFPFEQPELNAIYDQSSGGAALEFDAPPNSTDSIDNLLATLVEDNANSLPPVSDDTSITPTKNNADESIADEAANNFCVESIHALNSESSSCPAIADSIQNGSSQETKVDGLDAEMVSEDELPAPNQPKVDDAEEVSDEELPGPKLAELPADTEVVSEDELPASNRVKRKADESYDPSSPTDSAPEKRSKPDAGAFAIVILLGEIR